jgi:hypothetical protein
LLVVHHTPLLSQFCLLACIINFDALNKFGRM